MENKIILLAVCGQVILTLLVWLWMFYIRLGIIFRKNIRSQDLAEVATFDTLMKAAINPSDNFENLFEMPVLFFVAMLVILFTSTADSLYGGLAWAFVGLRAIHSFIHCTSNRINYRFTAYALSSLILWGIWFRIGIHLKLAP